MYRWSCRISTCGKGKCKGMVDGFGSRMAGINMGCTDLAIKAAEVVKCWERLALATPNPESSARYVHEGRTNLRWKTSMQ